MLRRIKEKQHCVAVVQMSPVFKSLMQRGKTGGHLGVETVFG
jgi:hypothetical protein